jgi:hypothetical protein
MLIAIERLTPDLLKIPAPEMQSWMDDFTAVPKKIDPLLLMSFRQPCAWEDWAPDSHSAKTTRKHHWQ